MKHKRPVNLNLFTISFPIPAIASILHRISGVILFLAIPFILWALSLSLASQQDFDDVRQLFTSAWMKFIIWGVLSALVFHLIAGIRHLLMDMGIGEELKSGKLGAQITIGISIVFIILVGIWLW